MSMNTYVPDELLTLVLETDVSLLVKVIVAPWTTAPLESLIVPLITAEDCCASAVDEVISIARTDRHEISPRHRVRKKSCNLVSLPRQPRLTKLG